MSSTNFSKQQVELVDYDDYEGGASNATGTGSQKPGVGGKRRICKFICCAVCVFLLFAIILTIYFLYPKSIQLCYKFDFGMDVVYRLAGDVDEYDIKIKNSNYYNLNLHDVQFDAYYGPREEATQVFTFDIGDWSIGPRTTSGRNATYTYTQAFVSVVDSTTLYYCSLGMIDDLTFNVSATMQGCILGTCRNIDKQDLTYVRDCPSDGGWKCLDYTIKIF